jgi:hypothetical protein
LFLTTRLAALKFFGIDFLFITFFSSTQPLHLRPFPERLQMIETHIIGPRNDAKVCVLVFFWVYKSTSTLFWQQRARETFSLFNREPFKIRAKPYFPTSEWDRLDKFCLSLTHSTIDLRGKKTRRSNLGVKFNRGGRANVCAQRASLPRGHRSNDFKMETRQLEFH